jgi:hypothetical protein
MMAGSREEIQANIEQIEGVIARIEAALDIANGDETLTEWQREMQRALVIVTRNTNELAKTVLQQTATMKSMAGVMRLLCRKDGGGRGAAPARPKVVRS